MSIASENREFESLYKAASRAIALVPIERRLTVAVAQKLNLTEGVLFSHWIKRATGDVPVFEVPSTHGALARSLGLTVKTYD